jgi:phospholipid/cholesterol/gamma-HCH transport system substrate-binding protein
MDRDANYVAVGAFVLLLLAMATGFVLWYSETGDRRSYQRYEIYFDGSVFGLSQGGSVRYLGVAVGRVTRIELDPRDASRVRIIADISEDTPIKADTVASLALQGVTGLLFIDLKPADPDKARTQPVPSINYPVIPSERSDFDVFVSSLPDAVAKASEVLNRMNAMLSDTNIKAVSDALAQVEAASKELPGTVSGARALLANLQDAAAQMRDAAAEARSLAANASPELLLAIKRLREAGENAAALTARIDKLVADNQDDVSRFASQGLPEIQAMARDIREAAQSINELGRQLKADPSQLIYQPPSRGVEIPP